MLSASLDEPDPAYERDAPSYSWIVATALQATYADRRDETFPQAETLLYPYFDAPMSERQRLRLSYALGCCALSNRWPSEASERFDEALDDAQRLDDAAAFAVIGERQAFSHYVNGSYWSASLYYLDALDALHSLPTALSAPLHEDARVFELELLWGLCTQRFLVADFDDAQNLVDGARLVGRSLPDPVRRVATIEWTAALLHRWKYEVFDAHERAQQAATLYATHAFGTPVERARLDIVVADTALDLAIFLSSGSRHDELVAEADARLIRALAQLRVAGDQIGEGMALLAYTRSNRLRGRPYDSLSVIRHVHRLGDEAGDRALQCQALTALGEELTARQQWGPALNAYRRALDALAPADASAMGWRARDALIAASRAADA